MREAAGETISVARTAFMISAHRAHQLCILIRFHLGVGPNCGRLELRRPNPDIAWISRKMPNFFYAVAAQGTMQVLTIIIMARFVSGI